MPTVMVSDQVARTITRIAHEVVERHSTLEKLALIGIRTRGVPIARRLSTVLHDITLHARPGQCVAIVGSTAAGKSTLLSLVPRFYDPDAGRILLDGTDVRALDVESLRRQIGIVFQESFLFSNTIASNIAFF